MAKTKTHQQRPRRLSPHFRTTIDMLRYALKNKDKRDVPAPDITVAGEEEDSEIPETFGRVFAALQEARELLAAAVHGSHSRRKLNAKLDERPEKTLDDLYTAVQREFKRLTREAEAQGLNEPLKFTSERGEYDAYYRVLSSIDHGVRREFTEPFDDPRGGRQPL